VPRCLLCLCKGSETGRDDGAVAKEVASDKDQQLLQSSTLTLTSVDTSNSISDQFVLSLKKSEIDPEEI
jgi:hypothetical protein